MCSCADELQETEEIGQRLFPSVFGFSLSGSFFSFCGQIRQELLSFQSIVELDRFVHSAYRIRQIAAERYR